ncbi:MauE/DoxX family redox-associated membrane protein [Mucilaginibacter phyllosphaerae]
MKKQNLIDLLSTLIMVMFLYAAFSKYFDWAAFERSMESQPFQEWFAKLLMIIVPPVEILAAGLLLFSKTRLWGLILSSILMALFTGYVAAALIGMFPQVPCSCGGIIRALGWKQHLVFNLFFLLISVTGARLQITVNQSNNKPSSPGN